MILYKESDKEGKTSLLLLPCLPANSSTAAANPPNTAAPTCSARHLVPLQSCCCWSTIYSFLSFFLFTDSRKKETGCCCYTQSIGLRLEWGCGDGRMDGWWVHSGACGGGGMAAVVSSSASSSPNATVYCYCCCCTTAVGVGWICTSCWCSCCQLPSPGRLQWWLYFPSIHYCSHLSPAAAAAAAVECCRVANHKSLLLVLNCYKPSMSSSSAAVRLLLLLLLLLLRRGKCGWACHAV